MHPENGQQLLFIEVPGFDVTTPKRIHLDLRPTGASRDEELRTLLALGATQVADHRGTHGPATGWVVLADPEGDQFCVLRNQREQAGEG